MKCLPSLIAWLLALNILGCKRGEDTSYNGATTNAPTIGIGPLRTSLNVWYVEDDGFGHNGYACVYGSVSVAHPGGKGLFQSIDALGSEIHSGKHTGMIIESEYRGRVPRSWRIRNLTESELRFLRSEVDKHEAK